MVISTTSGDSVSGVRDQCFYASLRPWSRRRTVKSPVGGWPYHPALPAALHFDAEPVVADIRFGSARSPRYRYAFASDARRDLALRSLPRTIRQGVSPYVREQCGDVLRERARSDARSRGSGASGPRRADIACTPVGPLDRRRDSLPPVDARVGSDPSARVGCSRGALPARDGRDERNDGSGTSGRAPFLPGWDRPSARTQRDARTVVGAEPRSGRIRRRTTSRSKASSRPSCGPCSRTRRRVVYEPGSSLVSEERRRVDETVNLVVLLPRARIAEVDVLTTAGERALSSAARRTEMAEERETLPRRPASDLRAARGAQDDRAGLHAGVLSGH